MTQEELVKVDISKWSFEDYYEEMFRLKLTAKHQLVVSKWTIDNDWGVDLRRWSYHQSRLLGAGILFNSFSWKKLFETLYTFYKKELFSKTGEIPNEAYYSEIELDPQYQIQTDVFISGVSQKFFCINLLRDHQQVRKGKYTRIGILINFDVIEDFIIECKNFELIPNYFIEVDNQIDKKTGRTIF